jgi:hypothetical protein
MVNRRNEKVTEHQGAKAIAETFVASKRAVSHVPSSWPIESTPRTSIIATSVTCSFSPEVNEASSTPNNPIASRSPKAGITGPPGTDGGRGAGGAAGVDGAGATAVCWLGGDANNSAIVMMMNQKTWPKR